MRSEAARLGGISLDFLPGSHLSEMKIFHMKTRKWASPARWNTVFFNQLCFVFQMLINIKTFVLHDGFIVKQLDQAIFFQRDNKLFD